MPVISFIATVVAAVSGELSTAFAPRPLRRTTRCALSSGSGRRERTQLCLSSDDASPDKVQEPPPRALSASRRERRDEEKRRKDRVQEGFATPGLSSAMPGARDLPLDVAETERQYLESLKTSSGRGRGTKGDNGVADDDDDDAEYKVAVWTEEGLDHLRMLRFAEASASFAKVYGIKAEAYLWQDGLLKYYAGDYHGAAESLAGNARRYEARFGEPASEERIWRDAAELKIVQTLNGGRRAKDGGDFPAAMRVPREEGTDPEEEERDSIADERRKVFRLARQLFSSSLRNNSAGEAMARTQLEAMCGPSFPTSLTSVLAEDEQPNRSPASPDPKMYRLLSLFFLGLHYDACGQSFQSKQCMKMALKTCADRVSGNSQDITFLLPVIHMTIRDWYDDDEFDASDARDEEARAGGEDDATSDATHDRLRESIKSMRVVDLKGELKRRRLKVSGSKEELRERLIHSLQN